jgi:hypothetical protein
MSGGPTMIDAASIASLTTRREVRGFLARGLNDLVDGQAQEHLSAELAGLATDNDGEVIESYRRLDKFCQSRGATDAKYSSTGLSHHARDLFARALQRMKELPPDPRETLHAKPRTSLNLHSDHERAK